MDVYEAIRTRRSIRKYKDKPVPWDNIVTILQAGKYAPSAGNLQNWKFLVVKSESRKRAVAKACMNQEWMEQAPILIIVIGEPERARMYYGARGARIYTIQGCAAAIQNMLLAAHNLGLGACWVGAFDEDAIFEILDLAEERQVQGIIALGYADETPEPPPKFRIEHVMYFEKWWGRRDVPRVTHTGWWSGYYPQAISESKQFLKRTGKKIKEHIQTKIKKKDDK